ncbi:HEL252Wp [Eremothecium sinecaudum]|uniref:HEL252Wp n=1 Tax=Eremothecium sinecaudum TaxID=45286 RepID=A0A0X8HT73_9SACH|nr:HEL252Wp [Eremothecium sinecaudum]AMD21029.1 HEL252Wp [Eremothecium sinecaudum]
MLSYQESMGTANPVALDGNCNLQVAPRDRESSMSCDLKSKNTTSGYGQLGTCWSEQLSTASTFVDPLQDMDYLRGMDMIKEFMDLKLPQNQVQNPFQEPSLLSISGYDSGNSKYYEYEFCGGKPGFEDFGADVDLMATDDEDLYNMSYRFDSPSDNERKNSIFSNRGNDIEMTLSGENSMSSNVSEYPALGEVFPIQHRRKMKERLKWNIFGTTGKSYTAAVPSAAGYRDSVSEEPQQLFKKKFFWSRKPTVPIMQAKPQHVNPLEQGEEKESVNPNDLFTELTFDSGFTLDGDTLAANDFDRMVGGKDNDADDLTSSLGGSQNDFLIQLHSQPLPPEDTGTVSIATGVSKPDLHATRRKMSIPKIRGRKASPALNATKPFGCEYCDRRFKRQEHLKRHVRSLHMGEKPYDCKICGKKFSRSDNLNQHIKTHPNSM